MHQILFRFTLAVLLLAGGWSVPRAAAAQDTPPQPVYLIVAPAEFSTILNSYIDTLWESRGFDVQTLWLSSPLPAKEDIKAAIGSLVPRPKYVLLVGNDELIPAWPVETDRIKPGLTDLYYTAFDGPTNYTPNSLLGRLPVQTEEELSAYLAKLANYYSIQTFAPWMKRISFVATNDYNFATSVEANFTRIISTYTTPYGYSGTFTGQEAPTAGGDRLFPETYGATREDVIASLNGGRVALVFHGRATDTSFDWRAGPWLTAAEVTTLAHPVVPLVAAFAPYTATFDPDTLDVLDHPSMADAWLFHPTSGALTYIGASVDTVSAYDEDLAEGIFKGLFSAPASPLSIGEAFQTGLQFFGKVQPDNAQMYYETYRLLGDPSLQIRSPEGALITAPVSYFAAPWGGTLTIPFTITNVGPLEASFEITVQSNAEYPLIFDPLLMNPTLESGASIVLPITIDIVTDLPLRTFDTITLTACQGKCVTAAIKTKLEITLQAFKPSVFLPLIRR